MWNERYAVSEYVYGLEPNSFLVEQAGSLRGPILSLAEGEGRNAVFLASLGLTVHCVDGSEVALGKAETLARSRGVKIDYEVADLAVYQPKANTYGAVISIFAHLPGQIRARLYPLVEQSLLPGGIILLEAYSERQLERATGGPKDVDWLMSEEKVASGFPNCEPILLRQFEREVREGIFHTGLASVVQFLGRRRA